MLSLYHLKILISLQNLYLLNSQKNINLIRRNLASRGLIENISYSFVSSEFSDLSPKGRKPIKLLNPISEDLSDMRSSPLISL